MTNQTQVEILLVEDNPHDAEMTMMALNEHNLANHVVWLKDGKEAIDFIFAQGEYASNSMVNLPKVLLLDLKLPKIGGMDVIRKLKSDPRTELLPIVILTSSNEDRDITEGYKLGINSYIVKPVDFDKFTKSIKDVGYYWVLLNQPPK